MCYNSSMKRFLILLVPVFIFPAFAFAQPLIQFEGESHDFGEVKQGMHVEHVFEFRNAGTSDLDISHIVPT